MIVKKEDHSLLLSFPYEGNSLSFGGIILPFRDKTCIPVMSLSLMISDRFARYI